MGKQQGLFGPDEQETSGNTSSFMEELENFTLKLASVPVEGIKRVAVQKASSLGKSEVRAGDRVHVLGEPDGTLQILSVSNRHVIAGNVPSKSNCYRIITFKSKGAKPKTKVCSECKGYHYPVSHHICAVCKGTGLIEVPPAPRASLAKSSDLKSYEKSFLFQWNVQKHRQAPITGKFKIEVDVYYPGNRSDLDNSLKVLLDCLQASGTIPNDNLCMEILAKKFIDKERPRVEFLLHNM